MTTAALVGLLAPFSQESEEALLGACLINEDAFTEVSTFLMAEDFYLLRHTYIWQAFVSLVADHMPLDFVAVQDKLRAMNRIDDIGGSAYLLHLVNSTPTSTNAAVYGQIVQRAAGRRRLLTAADEIKALAMDEELSYEKVMADSEARFNRVRSHYDANEDETLAQIVSGVVEDIEQRMRDPDQAPGVPTGFRDYDELLGGFQKTDLIVLAARPGVGKSSLMLNAALNAAKKGIHIGVASQEMSREQVVHRLIAMEADLNLKTMREGRMNNDQYKAFVKAYGLIGTLPIAVTDANRLTPQRLRSKALRWQARDGLDLLMVDYLQILSSGGLFRSSERVQEVSYFARELKQMARELRVPVLAAAQLNREVEKRADKRPQLSDLKEAGAIEEEADIVSFIYRDVLYNEATEFPNRAEIITAKNRSGPTGTVYLHFERTRTRFSDARTQTLDLSAL